MLLSIIRDHLYISYCACLWYYYYARITNKHGLVQFGAWMFWFLLVSIFHYLFIFQALLYQVALVVCFSPRLWVTVLVRIVPIFLPLLLVWLPISLQQGCSG